MRVGAERRLLLEVSVAMRVVEVAVPEPPGLGVRANVRHRAVVKRTERVVGSHASSVATRLNRTAGVPRATSGPHPPVNDGQRESLWTAGLLLEANDHACSRSAFLRRRAALILGPTSNLLSK